jgi:AraC-like DNA-binding protein
MDQMQTYKKLILTRGKSTNLVPVPDLFQKIFSRHIDLRFYPQILICILSTDFVIKIAISPIYLSYNDIMGNVEYIRAVRDPSRSSILSLPGIDGTAYLTFLHAGRSSWPESDTGLTAITERGHSHDVYHALLYTSGRNTMIHDGRTHVCRRGTMVLTDPGSVHEYRPQSPGGSSFIEITFNLQTERTVIAKPWNEVISCWLGKEFSFRNWPYELEPPKLELVESLMNDVVRALTSAGDPRDAHASLAMGRFIVELAAILNRQEDSLERYPDRLELARINLEENFSSPLAVSQLASIACLSEGAFIRSFSSRFGMPPMAYRKMLRITAAKHLLDVSGRSVGEIASKVGYSDIFAFSRTFKSVTGLTATQWRKSGMR